MFFGLYSYFEECLILLTRHCTAACRDGMCHCVRSSERHAVFDFLEHVFVDREDTLFLCFRVGSFEIASNCFNTQSLCIPLVPEGYVLLCFALFFFSRQDEFGECSAWA